MHIDTLIIGAGISGIGMAVYLQKHCPKRHFLILEHRERLGGTWDLFRYPNIRSDSDMLTFSYGFKPWQDKKLFASGQAILDYLQETAEQYQILPKIKFQHQVKSLNWDTQKKIWQITIVHHAQVIEMTANFVIGATGYYQYEQGFMPDFAEQEKFQGQIIHPQHWQHDLDVKNKQVVVIGSGATAITLVPALVKQGAKVTMLQRSPTYVVALPEQDQLYLKLQKILPQPWVYQLARQRNILTQQALYLFAKKKPKLLQKVLHFATKKQLQGKVDIKHFSPNYLPWQQRLCVAPDGDLFKVLRDGQAKIYTEQIEKFDQTGIILNNGEHLDADIIISATGLNIALFGGAELSIDGQDIDLSQRLMYNGLLMNNVPNFVMLAGYPNASWTLRIDIIADYICRLLNEMQDRKAQVLYADGTNAKSYPISTLGSALNAGYVKRAEKLLPRQGKARPWRGFASYYAEKLYLKRAKFDDGILKFE
ncbi:MULTISPECIES: flavin-containing monooxygenase [unclassified Acinetobacter]|uniref:flavin-containing monooxygenase n=1 Tax=unclassified Acinetobacter TaxID=196816 RepID=UPI0035BB7ED0